jgi:CBS domain-containing protein
MIGAHMRAADLCSREVYLAKPEQALAEAAREMKNRHVGVLVVVRTEGRITRPIGVLTDRDVLVGQLARKADLFCLTVGDVMTAKPITVNQNDDVGQIVQRLASARVRRAPVVNDAGDLVGILSLDDLLPAVAEEISMLARLIGTQSLVETRRSPPARTVA